MQKVKTPGNENLDEAPLPMFNKPLNDKKIVNEDKKKKLLQNYILTDLSYLQEIEFKFHTNKEKIKIYPKMEVEINDSKYYVFYNNDLIKLKKIFFYKLDDIIDEHYVVLNYDKTALYEKANTSISETKSKLPIQVLRMIGNLIGPQSYLFAPINIIRKVVSLTDTDIINLAKIYATSSANINYLINTYGCEIIKGKICYILIKKTFDDFISFNSSDDFSMIEQSLVSIFKSGIPDVKIIENLYILTKNLIYTYNSSNEIFNICFILFRASYYLGKFESELQNKDVLTLEKMDEFKKYLFENYLNYRFPVYKNISPIQDIMIYNCHIIQLDNEKKIIYMNRVETQRYIILINEDLNSKINVKRQNNLNALKDNELMELIQSIDFNSNKDIEKFIENKIIDLEAQKNVFQNIVNNIFINYGISLIKNGNEVILDIKSKANIIKFSEKEIEDSIEKERKNGNTFSMNKIVKSSFEKTFVENKPSKNFKQTPGSNFETIGFPNNEITKKENFSIIRKKLIELKFDTEIDDILNGFKYYINSNQLEKQIDILKNQKNQLIGTKDYMNNFINLIKLYNQLKKKKLDINDEYEGILLTEKKQFTKGLNGFNRLNGNEILMDYNIMVFKK